ncbi:MAG: hypothetical protein MJ176_09685 [Treponema sp.]|nr:hypothetical protein [Treponema sp.]
MKNPTLALLKIFFKNSWNLETTFGTIKKGPKGVAKIIGLGLLMIYLLGAMGLCLIGTLLGLYRTLAMFESTHIMPMISIGLGALCIFFFGFITAATTYYTGNGEEQFIAMPFPNKSYFMSKFMVSFVSDASLGIIIMVAAGIIYGNGEGLLGNVTFWLGLISCAALLSTVTVFLIYLVLVLLMYFVPAFRKKKALTSIASVLLFVFVLAISLTMSSGSNFVFTDGGLTTLLPDEIVAGLVTKIDGIFLTKYAFKAFRGNLIAIIVFFAISALILLMLVPLLSNMYVASLDGFTDVQSKKMSEKEIERTLKKDIKTRSTFQSLFIRDVRGVLREPTFFSNGPLLLIILPLIMVFSFSIGFVVSSEDGFLTLINELRTALAEMDNEVVKTISYYITLFGGVFTIFMGVNANIATTAFSREGKTMYTLKAMPIDYDMLVEVKFLHALMYCAVAYIEVAVIFGGAILLLNMPFTLSDYLQIMGYMLLFSGTTCAFLLFVDMFIDTVNPKLNWDNPVFAFKSNMNTLFSVLATLVSAAILGVVGVVFHALGNWAFLILAVIFLILAAVTGALYNKYAMKKLPQM